MSKTAVSLAIFLQNDLEFGKCITCEIEEHDRKSNYTSNHFFSTCACILHIKLCDQSKDDGVAFSFPIHFISPSYLRPVLMKLKHDKQEATASHLSLGGSNNANVCKTQTS